MIAEFANDVFQDRVNIILDELLLGFRWERSSLILAVYLSEHTKTRVQDLIARNLGASGRPVINYFVDRSHYDIPLSLLNHPQREGAVYFVSGLRWGGGRGYSNAYRALNMHREYLVEGNLKAIFWITRTELRQLTRFSPDFWAFRHKVVEFFDLPSEDEYTLLKPSQDSIHHLFTTHSQDFQTRIAAAERAFSLGCRQEAILKFRQALRKYKHETTLYLRIAEIYLSLGQLPAAARNLRSAQQAGNRSPDFGREVDRLLLAVRSAPASIGGFSDRTI